MESRINYKPFKRLTMADSDIFLRDNLTDFEKLLFAKREVKELKEEIKQLNQDKGVLNSQIDELRYNYQKDKPTSRELQVMKVKLSDSRKKQKFFKQKYEENNAELVQFRIKQYHAK